MRSLLIAGFSLGVLAAAASPATAVPSLTLSSSTDLTTLAVGQSVVIDATLSGLSPLDVIFDLNSAVLFPASLFTAVPDPTTVSGLTPGSILTSAQVSDFDSGSTLTSGSAIGDFAQLMSSAIEQNGLFYEFTLTAAAPGSGSISFDPTPGANEYASLETGLSFAPLLTGDALAFDIISAAVPAPEPATLALLGSALAGLWVLRRRRNHV